MSADGSAVPAQALTEGLTDANGDGSIGFWIYDYGPGDRVEIPKGPFAGLLATVVTVMSSRRRIKLLIDFLARRTCVEMPLFSVREPSTNRTTARSAGGRNSQSRR